MKCARCHRHIPKGEEMVEKIGGRLVPTHRDCGINYATPPPKWSLYQEDPERVLAREKTRAAILKENNTVCPICREEMLHTVHCPKQKKAVCEEHCLICGYHRRPTPANNGTCLYTKKAPAGTGA